ncbi:MAG: myo-inositol-1-phosphate synthase, partial [Desulfurococcaceae archaeon]
MRTRRLIRVAILGQGLVATHFAVGLERLKRNEIRDYGVPLRDRIKYSYDDIEIVVSYDVDKSKIGRTVYDIALKVFDERNVPSTLKDIEIREGIHLGSLKGLPFEASGREEKIGLDNAIEEIVDDWKNLGVDIVLNLITTEPAVEFMELSKLQEALETTRLSATQAYAYALARYSRRSRSSAFINNIPVPIANDDAFVKLYVESNAVVFGDDASTGATPLTSDILEHMRERNRFVIDIAQFNIGGNTDFLSLDQPERNVMKKHTKSSIVRDILGYEAPNYIKPTGYLEPLGDKKFVAMILEY